MYKQDFSLCVCAPGLSRQNFSPGTHLSHSTEDGSGGFILVSGALPIVGVVVA